MQRNTDIPFSNSVVKITVNSSPVVSVLHYTAYCNQIRSLGIYHSMTADD